ncbi:MAG TPA: ABC transporter ATP-binding protein [Gammaproteobacteria bacterium]|nr:ABC transporter ATP-binding protein [Gammaproteobacteria bacterium]
MIRLENITRDFRVGEETVHALLDVNLEIGAGEYVSIMGPSGSGKSTLLHLLGLLDRPTAGHYWFDDQETSALDEEQQARLRQGKIGFVFQFFHLIPRLTAAENVELPLMLAGIEPEERRARVAKALEGLGLSDRAAHRPEQLSGGQRQRVAIARATVIEPALILADEPTGNLDRASGHDVIHILEALNANGITLIVVTHDPELGGRARRRLHMLDGRLAEDSGAT